MLRVIAGKYRGQKLKQPSLEITRPTNDKTKEAIFSSLQFRMKNSLVLDLFSGSCSLAIEAISRGAVKAIAIENNKTAFLVMQKNIKALNITNISLIKCDAITYLILKDNIKFDVIFIDPPYEKFRLINQALFYLASKQMLKTLGIIILETTFPYKIEIPKNFIINKKKQYGKTTILLITNNI